MVIGIDTEQPVLSDSLGLLILLEQSENHSQFLEVECTLAGLLSI